MKTRTLSLPLVILATLLWRCDVYAQHVAHYELYGFLEKMPSAPVFPDNSALSSTAPTDFEDNSDLNAIEKNIRKLTTDIPRNDLQMGTILETSQKTAPPSESDNPSMEHTLASLQSTLKDMQAVKIEFTQNFRRLEEICSKRVEDAYAAMRKLQMEQPCKGNIECELEHIRKKNTDLIAVIKEKTLNEQYLLFVYSTHLKESFKQVDNLLREANYGESAVTSEARNILYGAQQNQVMILGDIIERLKLERIIISNCARMAQEGRKK